MTSLFQLTSNSRQAAGCIIFKIQLVQGGASFAVQWSSMARDWLMCERRVSSKDALQSLHFNEELLIQCDKNANPLVSIKLHSIRRPRLLLTDRQLVHSDNPKKHVRVWPLIYDAASEHKNRAQFATSSGCPARPCGTSTGILALDAAICGSRPNGLSTKPGAIALHLRPCLP